ncbi:hypothetical protein SEA_PHINKY_99 [Microbacterium phage Phinky]|nr:hypothetical protein SEA_PHINKY_99 [Microbacterium phage Phinky]
MGKASRIKAQRGEFVREQKQPTREYRTAEQRRDERRKDREAAERSQDLIARLAASVANRG